MKENISDITSPIINDKHIEFIVLGRKKFKIKTVTKIFIISSINLQIAFLETLLNAVKYPLMAEDIEMNGRARQITYIMFTDILLCRQVFTMKLEKIKKIILAAKPHIKLIRIHFLATIFALVSLLQAISSEITLVAAILIPLDANVIPKIYTERIKENKPNAS